MADSRHFTLSATHSGQLNSIRKQALKRSELDSNCNGHKGHMMLLEMENLADAIDSADQVVEGSNNVSSEYRDRGWPYMRKYAITSLVYQLIMSPLMSSTLAKAEYNY